MDEPVSLPSAMQPWPTLAALNDLPSADWREALAGVLGFEGELPSKLEQHRPFLSVEALSDAMGAGIVASDLFVQLAWIRLCADWASEASPIAHQAGSEGQAAESGECQDPGALERQALEQVYREKFGFPYVPPFQQGGGVEALPDLRRRLVQGLDVEFGECLTAVREWVRVRLQARVAQG